MENEGMQPTGEKLNDKGRDVKRKGKTQKKEETKATRKKKVIAVLLLVSIIFGSFITFDMTVFANQQSQAKNTSKLIYEILGVDSLLDLIEIKGNETSGYYYDFIDGIEEKLEELAKSLQRNIKGSKRISEDLLKKMIKAEIVNQFPFLQGAGIRSASGNTVAEKFWNFFIGQGYSEISVAGMMGNIHQESGFNLDIIENGGSGEGIGLCQWSYGRRDKLEAYASSMGKPWSDLDIQFNYLLMELQGGTGIASDGFNGNNRLRNQWEKATTIEESTIAFQEGFERAGRPMMENRIHWANVYYERYRGTYMPLQSSSQGTQLGKFSGTVRIRRVTPNKNIGEVKNTGSGDITDTTSNASNSLEEKKVQKYLDERATSGKWSVYVKNLTSNSVKININNQKLNSDNLIQLFVMATAFEEIEVGNIEKNEIISDINHMMKTNDVGAADRIIDKITLRKVENYIATNNYNNTQINVKMSDNSNNNYTSALDVGKILEKMYRGTCVSKEASQEMIDILKSHTIKDKIPAGVPSGAETANQSAEGNKNESDATIVYKNGVHYVVVIISNDVENKETAKNDIKEMSKEIYNIMGKSSQTSTNENAPHKVAIVAGHGDPKNAGTYAQIANKTKWYTTGTSGRTPTGETWKEWEITKKVADYVQQFLYPYSSEIGVVQVGYSKKNWERMQLAKDKGVDSYVGIHFNSSDNSSDTGVSAYYRNGDETSQNFANIFARTVSENMGLRNNGTMDDSRTTNGKLDSIGNSSDWEFPSTIIEGGFMSNPSDMQIIGEENEEGLKKYASGIAEGILEYYQIENTGTGATTVTGSTTTTTQGVNSKVYDLRYVEPNIFNQYIESNDRQALYCYTLEKETKKLIIANWSYTTAEGIKITKSDPINFRAVLNKYTMPIEYLIDFLVHTDDEKMVGKLADLAIDTEYIIAVQDNVTTVQTTVDNQEKNYRTTLINAGGSNGDSNEVYIERRNYRDWHTVSKEITVTESVSNKIELTYADSWFVKFSKTSSYANIVNNSSEGNNLIADKGKKLGDFQITTYCYACNDDGSGNFGTTTTASGRQATENLSIAVNPSMFNEAGSHLQNGDYVIINDNVYRVDDVGPDWRDKKWIDIYISTNGGKCECNHSPLNSNSTPVYVAKNAREVTDEELRSNVEEYNRRLKGVNTIADVLGEVKDTTTVMEEILPTIIADTESYRSKDYTERKKITTVRTISNQYDSGKEEVEQKEQDFIDVFLSSKGILKKFNMGWMETLLSQSERTVNMIDLTKYLYNKAKDYEYNIENNDSYNFDVYKRNDLYQIYASSGILEEFIKSLENNALRLYMNNHASIDEGLINKYITTDTEEPTYKMLTNSYGGRGFGFNIFHRLNTNDWNTGKPNEKRILEHYEELSIDIKQYVDMEQTIETNIVDQVMRKEIQKWRDVIEEEMQGFELEEYQLDALTVVAYQYGWSKKDTQSFKNAYLNYYIKNRKEAFQNNFAIAQNTLKPFYLLSDVTNKTEEEKKQQLKAELTWHLFDTGEYKTPEGEILDPDSFHAIGSGELLGVAQEIWKIVCDRFTTYGPLGNVPPSDSKTTIDCSGYVSWVLYEYGKVTGNDALVREFQGWQETTYTMPGINWDKLGFETIPIASGEDIRNKIQPGDIIVREGGGTHHTQIIVEVKNGRVYTYDCGNARNWLGKNGEAVDKTYFTSSLPAPGVIIRKR